MDKQIGLGNNKIATVTNTSDDGTFGFYCQKG